MPTISDFVETTVNGFLVPAGNVWVRMRNNTTSVDYFSTSTADANTGEYTVNSVPVGMYSIYTGPAATVGGTPNLANPNYPVAPFNVEVFNVQDYGAVGNGTTDDTVAINAAIAAAHTANGGIVWLPQTSTSYKITNLTTITKPGVSLVGAGTQAVILKCVATSGDAVSSQMNPFTTNQAGKIGGFTIDGQGASAGVTGLHYGDVIGGHLDDLAVQFFNKSGSKGIWIDNRTNWTERTLWTRVWVNTCTTDVLFDVNGGQTSWGYHRIYDLRLNVITNQTGIKFQAGGQLYNSTLTILGNYTGPTVSFMYLTGNCSVANTVFSVQAELMSSTGTGLTIDAGSTLTGTGLIALWIGAPVSSNAGTLKFSGQMRCPGIYNNDGFVGIGGVGVETSNIAPTNFGLWTDNSSVFLFGANSVVLRPGGSGVATGQTIFNTTGKLLFVAGQGIDVAAAGTLLVGTSTATSVQVGTSTATIGVGGASVTNVGLNIATNVTASSANASSVRILDTLTAAADNDVLQGINISTLTAATGTFVGLEVSGLKIRGAQFATTGTGTVANAYGVNVSAPTIGTNNFIIAGAGGKTSFSDNVTTSGIVNTFVSTALSSGALMRLFHNTSASTGIGLQMLMADAGSGSFSGKFLEFQNNSSVKFNVDSTGKATAANKIYPGTDAAATQAVAGIYAGNGVPNNANGANGDFYFRGDGTQAANTVIYHREGGAWVALVTT